MKKVDIVDCVKQIIAINKTLEDHDQRQDYHVTYMAELRDRIEKLEKLQASSSKQQAWQGLWDLIGYTWSLNSASAPRVEVVMHNPQSSGIRNYE